MFGHKIRTGRLVLDTQNLKMNSIKITPTVCAIDQLLNTWEPLIEKKVRAEMELMFKSKLEKILGAQEDENSRSSKTNNKVEKQDKSIAGMLQKFFMGKSDFQLAIKENNGGIIEVNEEYLDSDSDSHGSVSSAASAASKRNRQKRNTI